MTKYKIGENVYVFFSERDSVFGYLGIRKAKIVGHDVNEQYFIKLTGLRNKERKQIKSVIDEGIVPVEQFIFPEEEIYKTEEEILLKKIGGEL